VQKSTFRLALYSSLKNLHEKRKLAEPPKESVWSRTGVVRASAIAQAWEKYFNDHVGLRKLLIAGHGLITYELLRTSPNPAVVLVRR